MTPGGILAWMTVAAVIVAVFGRWRLALAMGSPALTTYVVWPIAWHYLQALPIWLLVVLGVCALPFALLRAIYSLLRFTLSAEAADEAVGIFVGHGLIALAGLLCTKRPPRK